MGTSDRENSIIAQVRESHLRAYMRGENNITPLEARAVVSAAIDARQKEIRRLEERIEDVMASGTPWPLRDVLAVLVEAVDHLLLDHDCDRHGHERVGAARDAAKDILRKLEQ